MLGIWVGIDARERGWTKWWAYTWGVATFFMCFPFSVVYFVLRNRVPKTATAAPAVSACRYCGKEIIANPAFCPHCSAQLKSAEEIHRKS